MNLRALIVAGFVAVMSVGCGSGNGEVVTDPSKLAPLTEAEQAEIKKQDLSVEQEEGASQKIIFSKNKTKK